MESNSVLEKKSDNLGNWIISLIEDFIERSPENTLQNQAQEKAFENPLVGFSKGDDPLYQTYKEVVGPYHWTPQEIFGLTFSESVIRPQELTVISWILPQTKISKADNRKEKIYPSERWARARIYGEEVNVKLRRLVVSALEEKGIQAIAPMLSPLWERKRIGAVCPGLHLVRTTRRLCRRLGNLRPLRRVDHPKGQGHPLRVGGRQSVNPPNAPDLRPS